MDLGSLLYDIGSLIKKKKSLVNDVDSECYLCLKEGVFEKSISPPQFLFCKLNTALKKLKF